MTAAVERAAGNFDLVISFQISGLPVERQMREVFLDEHIDNHRVGELALFHRILGPQR